MIIIFKQKNPPKIQPFRLIFIATTILLLIDLIYFIYKVNFKPMKPKVDSNIKYEEDIFDIIELDYKAARIAANLFLLACSIYIFIFIDSLHKSIREWRLRLYYAAKLW